MFEIDHHIHVSGTGSYLPDRVVDNAAMEGMVSNFDGEGDPFDVWVDRVTHIHERRQLHRDRTVADMAREACRIALETSGVDPAEIGLFVMATFTTKNIYPGEETMLTEELGMKGAPAFYLTAACAGGVYGMQVAHAFLRAGFCRHALVVAAEHLTAIVDYRDPLTAILFGDGAGAAVLSRRDAAGPGGVVRTCVLGSEYAPGSIMFDNMNVSPEAHLFTMNGDGGARDVVLREYLRMEGGPRVLRNAVNHMAQAVVEGLGFTMGDLKRDHPELRELLRRIRVVPHQANGRIVDGLRDKLGVDDERVYKTIYLYGNISAASNMITWDYAARRGNMRRVLEGDRTVGIEEDVAPRLRTGDLVSIPTVGAGYRTGCFTYVHEEY